MKYKMRLTWCVPANCWILDLLSETGEAIIAGMAVVTGCNLIEQFAYLGIGGQFIAQTENDTDSPPTFENMGTLGHVYFFSP